MAEPSVLETDRFQELTLEQRQTLCAALFHTINWFRELVCSVTEVYLQMHLHVPTYLS